VTTPCTELEGALAQRRCSTGDETGHRTNGEKRWLWVIVAPRFVVYRIATTRAADVLVVLLGDIFEGVLRSTRRWRDAG
jgi:hypothetical protein